MPARIRIGDSYPIAKSEDYANGTPTAGSVLVSGGQGQPPVWGTGTGGASKLFQALLPDPVEPAASPAVWQTVGTVTINVGVSIATDKWLCHLNMDIGEDGETYVPIAVRVGQSIDSGADTASAGASTGNLTLDTGGLRQADVAVVISGIVAATSLVFKAQILGGWTSGTPVGIDRCNLIVEKFSA